MDKPFKTIEEQIVILRKRGLTVDEKAYSVLEREGYYPVINGYKDPFLLHHGDAQQGETYVPGTTFEDIHRLFVFDRALRATMFSNFAKAEATLKTVCSYVFAERYQDVENAYLKRESYSDEGYLQGDISNLIKSFQKIIGYKKDGNLQTKRQYIAHYVTRHDNVPIWVLSNYLSFGKIFKFYCFQKESVRNEIAKRFSEIYAKSHERRLRISPRRLRLAYDHIKDFRNICAHDERLYYARVSPSKDTNLLGVFRDLALVLTQDDLMKMLETVARLMIVLANGLGVERSSKVFSEMGVADIQMLLSIADQR